MTVGSPPGTYTLFQFDSAHGLTDGLVVGSGLGSFTGSFDYATDPNLIQLNVVPEPQTAFLIIAGIGLLLFSCNRRRRVPARLA